MFRLAMIPAALGLLVGMALGLARLGWEFWPPWATPPLAHGPLMVGGFLGTLVALERARAVGRAWALAGPIASGAGGLAMLAGLPDAVGGVLCVAGAVGLAACYAVILRRRNDLAGWTQLVGAGTLVVGLALWTIGWEPYRVIGWWMAFLVATIAGERLELTRMLPHFNRRAAWFAAALSLLAVGVVVSAVGQGVRVEPAWDAGERLTGAGLLAVAAWCARFDMARVGIRHPGPPRYTAVGLLAGYAWLGVAGALLVATGAPTTGALYDARLHAVFLGFAISMVFVHAPMVGRAVLGITVPHGRHLYIPLGLLHASLVVRVCGDLGDWLPVRQWAALGNVVAVLVFLVTVVGGVVVGARAAGASPARG